MSLGPRRIAAKPIAAHQNTLVRKKTARAPLGPYARRRRAARRPARAAGPRATRPAPAGSVAWRAAARAGRHFPYRRPPGRLGLGLGRRGRPRAADAAAWPRDGPEQPFSSAPAPNAWAAKSNTSASAGRDGGQIEHPTLQVALVQGTSHGRAEFGRAFGRGDDHVRLAVAPRAPLCGLEGRAGRAHDDGARPQGGADEVGAVEGGDAQIAAPEGGPQRLALGPFRRE